MKLRACFSLFILALAIAVHSRAFAQVRRADPVVHDAAREMCRGEIAKARELNQSVLNSEPNNLNARLFQLGLMDRESLSKVLHSNVLNANDLSQIDRLTAATAMLVLSSDDRDRIKSLIRFSSSDREMESYRLTLQAQMAFLDGDKVTGINDLLRAESIAKNLDSGLLSLILAETHQTPDGKKIAERLRKSVEMVPDDTPIKSTLKAYLLLAESGWERRDEINRLFKESYDSCPWDPGISVNYAFLLYYESDFAGVKRVLDQAIKSGIVHSPYVDYMMTAVYIFLKDYAAADRHLNLANKSISFFSEKERADLARFKDLIPIENEKAPAGFPLMGLTIAVLISSVVLWLFVRHRKRSQA